MNKNIPVIGFYSESYNMEILTREQEVELANKIKKGDMRAREIFIKANLRLVVSIAKVFFRANETFKQDIVQQGNIGLIDAVDNFDPNRGYRFSTFAQKRILAPILDFLKKNLSIKIPDKRQKNINRMLRIVTACGILNINTNKSIKRIRDKFNTLYSAKDEKVYKKTDIIEVLKDYKLLHQESLDSDVYNNESSTMMDFIEDVKSENPNITIKDALQRKNINNLLLFLKEEEIEVLNKLYGLNGRHSGSYVSVGKDMNMESRDVKKIEFMAFRKIRNTLPDLREEI